MSTAPRPPSAVAVAAGSFTIAVLVAAVVLGATRVLPALTAGPEPTPPGTPAAPVPLEEADRYAGVAQLRGSPACTAALIDSGSASGPGHLLTAGRCLPARGAAPNAVVLNQPSGRTAVFRTVRGAVPVEVSVARVAYRGMRGTDLALLELQATLADLAERGVSGYPLTSVSAPSGLPVHNLAVPVAVDPNEVVLRRGACRLGPRADVVEDGRLLDDGQATDCPGVLDGSVGSPLLDARDRLVGLLATTPAGTLPGGACFRGTPCERTPEGVRVVPERSYAVSPAGLGRCFSAQGRFALTDECPLPRPGLALDPGRTVYRSAEVAAQAVTPVALHAPARTPVRVGVASLTSTPVCADPATYTETATAGTGATYPPRLPPREGRYLLCVAEPGKEAAAAAAVFEVDDTPPVREPALAVQPNGDGYRISPLASPPELVRFRIKTGPVAATDCADPAGYAPAAGETTLAGQTLPARVCLVGFDLAGNEAAPWSTELPHR